MIELSPAQRLLAGLVSMLAWVGLVVQFDATMATTGDVGETLWVLARFFTVLTNLGVGIVLTSLALGIRQVTPSLLGGTTVAILLVGIVYGLLLQGLRELSGGAMLADILLHKVTPVLVPLFWLFALPRGGLTSRDPWLWALYPLAYLAYALVRGTAEGRFAYPFLDYTAHGWPYVFAHAVVMAAGFVLVGRGLVRFDRRLTVS